MSDYGEAMALYGAWQRGELQAEGLEAKARILAGYDAGNAEPLTADEREYMAREGLLAMEDYVQDKFGW